MRVGSLFSGIGGIDLGLERAGMEIVWQVEIDPFCQRVLAKHWPHVKRYGNIREVTGHELEPVDLICGGFPCQPVSVAGRRKGIHDDRWLWPEFARFIRVLRPRYVLVENVPNPLVVNGGAAMSEVLGDLAALGFDAEWQVLSAAQFGAPHPRERLYILAYTAGEHGQARRVLEQGGAWRPPLALGGFSGLDVATRRQAADAWLAREPRVDRMANGIPDQVDRLEALGNAVVPQVANWIGRRILAVEATTDTRAEAR